MKRRVNFPKSPMPVLKRPQASGRGIRHALVGSLRGRSPGTALVCDETHSRRGVLAGRLSHAAKLLG